MSHDSCSNCLGRRAFLGQSATLAGGAALASFGLGGCDDEGGSIPALKAPFSFKLSNKPELANVGDVTEIQPAESGYSAIIIVRKEGDTAFRAWSAYCNHEGENVEWQASMGRFRCPRHNAQFDADGSLTKGPATQGLLEFTVTVNGDDVTVSG